MQKQLSAIIILVLFCACVQAQNDSNFTVVEMFYNTGCYGSRSPMSQWTTYSTMAEQNNKNQIYVALHVYQPYGDWTDQYVLPLNTQRFNKYWTTLGILKQLAGIAKNGVRYTPHLWYNCKPLEDTATWDGVPLAKATAFMHINYESYTACDSTVHISYELAGGPFGDSIMAYFYAVERGITVTITGGENSGQTFLLHNVARAVVCVPTTRLSDTVSLTLPADANTDSIRILGYIQNDNTYRIIGGSKGFVLRDSVTYDTIPPSGDTTDYTLVYNADEVGISIYPNPISHVLYVHVPAATHGDHVCIYNTEGVLMGYYPLQEENSIYMANYAPGVYVLSVYAGGKYRVNKVMKL